MHLVVTGRPAARRDEAARLHRQLEAAGRPTRPLRLTGVYVGDPVWLRGRLHGRYAVVTRWLQIYGFQGACGARGRDRHASTN